MHTAAPGKLPVRRTTEIEEITNLHVIHPLAGWLVPIFARAHITPNAVSLAGMACGILAACAYYRYPDPRFALAGFALMIAWHVMDGADGQLARYTQTYSYFGKMIDGIADHVTFAAVYIALAAAASHRLGNGVFALAAISGVFHAIQSASYEAQRQEYERLGWGKKPQEPPPRASDGSGRARGGLRGLLDGLHRLFYVRLSFPAARANQQIRATVAQALEAHPGQAPAVRERYREALAPEVRAWSILSANYRTLGIFICALAQAPGFYFAFEIVGFSLILAVLVRRLRPAHAVLRSRLAVMLQG